ncbi:MAG: hypothetical protein N2578_02750 [Bdellovibrionaceae bacterium]|nr:hypothetical protein [Pseudobdellovibrionaceae bacterium]
MRLFCLVFLFFSFASKATLFSETVGVVGDRVITSRELEIASLVKQALESTKAQVPLLRYLLECAIFAEAESFQVGGVRSESVAADTAKVKAFFVSSGAMSRLMPTEVELRKAVQQYWVVRDYLQLKSEALLGVISEAEARSYFEKNRLKFGASRFEDFREQIKKVLAEEQRAQRLEEWYAILRRKHSVRVLRPAKN